MDGSEAVRTIYAFETQLLKNAKKLLDIQTMNKEVFTEKKKLTLFS